MTVSGVLLYYRTVYPKTHIEKTCMYRYKNDDYWRSQLRSPASQKYIGQEAPPVSPIAASVTIAAVLYVRDAALNCTHLDVTFRHGVVHATANTFTPGLSFVCFCLRDRTGLKTQQKKSGLSSQKNQDKKGQR